MKIGFTSTTFRNIKSLDEIVTLAKKADADCIEWGGDIHVKNKDDAKKAREICGRNNLTVNSYGSYYKIGSFDTGKWREICEICEILGASSVRVWLGKKGSARTDENEYKKLISDAQNICDEAKKYGLTVMPECHPNTYNDNTDAFLKFVKDLKRDNFKTYFQSLYRDLPYDFDRLERTLPYIKTVHISYSERMRMQSFRKHDTDYVGKLLERLKVLDYDDTVLLEYTYFASRKYFLNDMKKLRSRLGE